MSPFFYGGLKMKLNIRTIDETLYKEFGQKQENWSFLNIPGQKKKMTLRGWETEFLGFFDESGEIRAAALAAYGSAAKIYRLCLVPGGILMDWKDSGLILSVTEAFRSYLNGKNVLYAQMSPYIPLNVRDENGNIPEDGLNNQKLVEELKSDGWLWNPPAKGYDTTRDAMWMSVLDLRGKDMDTLLKEMDQQTRWSINRAKKFGLTVRPASSEKDLKDFSEMMTHTGERNHFNGENEDFYRSELEAYGDSSVLLLAFMEPKQTIEAQEKLKEDSEKERQEVTEKLEKQPNSKKFNKRLKVIDEAIELADKKIEEARSLQEKYGDEILLAGSIFMKTDRETVYLHSGAYDEFFKYNAPYAIHAVAIEDAVNNGRDYYNFYGITGNFNKDEEGYSLFDFKRGFGCHVVENLGTFILPVKKLEFSLFNRLKKLV